MITYKGFNKDMTCSPNGAPFQYEEGKEYETDKAECCNSGFHACEMPLDTFKYYQPSKSVYHEVEQSGEVSKSNDKTSSTKIRIGARLSVRAMVKAQIGLVFEKASNKNNATSGYRSSAATSGEKSSAATSGDWSSAATSGYRSSAATSGDWSSAATSGEESSAATSGEKSSAATSGYRSSAATSGEKSSAATSGEKSSAATSGDWSSAATSGYRSSAATSGTGSSAATSGEKSSAATDNKNAVALACGKNAKAKGITGSYLVLTEWNDEQTELICARMERVDGERIKANTWYKLESGEFVEVKDET